VSFENSLTRFKSNLNKGVIGMLRSNHQSEMILDNNETTE